LKSKDIRNQPQRFKTLGLAVSVGQEIEAVEASRPAELIASPALQNKAVVYDILFRPAAGGRGKAHQRQHCAFHFRRNIPKNITKGGPEIARTGDRPFALEPA